MSTNGSSLQKQLEDVQEQHRRYYLSEKLDDIAETMEETILQRVLAKAFFNESIPIADNAQQRVDEMLDLLEKQGYDEIESRIKQLETDVNSAETDVENEIQELRLQQKSTVTAMRRLNDRVDRVSSTRLQALQGLLGQWRWREHVYSGEDSDMPTLKSNAESYGVEMREAFDELKKELFGKYPPEIRQLIWKMIDDERLSYSDLTDEQRRQLAESDIAEYIELTLS